jgi:lipase
MLHPTEAHLVINHLDLCVWRWPGDDPPLLFVHATGFHGRCWDQVIARLGQRRCYALDLRGHGRSAKPAPPYDWRCFGEDVAAVARRIGFQEAIGIGHSVGGHALATAAALAPDVFRALLLIEPVILPRDQYGAALEGEHFAARRRDRWLSPAEMFERFRHRPPFDRWDAAVLRDYCEYGLLPAPDGDGCVLACPPAVESSIYLHSTAADIYPLLPSITVPVRVVRCGDPNPHDFWDMSASATAPDLAAHFRQGSDLHLPNATHFLPMEAPALLADLVREMIG